MRKFISMLVLGACVLGAGASFAQSPTTGTQSSEWYWQRAIMRNTTAASTIARNADWTTSGPASNGAFTDSAVFRRGATTRTVYDTTAAYAVATFPYGPPIGAGYQGSAAAGDTGLVWIVAHVAQDTLSYGFAGTSGGVTDTFRVAIEYSNDGVNWFSCGGTPTYRFDTVFLTSGQDGLQNPTLIGVEISPGQDEAYIPIRCVPRAFNGTAAINNQTACLAGPLMRFIIGGAYSGQYKFEIGHWTAVQSTR